MKAIRKAALLFLLAVTACAFFAPVIAPWPYERQFRNSPDSPPSARFLLGTDSIGRDRLSRLIYATRISVSLAPAAALVAITLALLISFAAASGVPLLPFALSGFTTIALSLPWLFAFIILRAELPLNTEPSVSIALTFVLMGFAGWAWPARVFTAALRETAQSGWVLQARANGSRPWRIAAVQVWPHLRALAAAQFRILIPAFILSEASLGLLGLGVAEPLPSWGNLLRDLQHPEVIRANPFVLAPLVLLMLVMVALEILQTGSAAAL